MRKLASSVILSGVAIASVAAAPVGWNGHDYEFVVAPGLVWTVADAAANARIYNGRSGHLVTITSQAENEFVATLIDGVTSYPGDPSNDSALEAWVGGFQDPPDEPVTGKGWKWVNGEGEFPSVNGHSTYANWFTDEPNDWPDSSPEQHLGIWGKDGYGNTIGSWNDEGGLWNITGYIVEFDHAQVPEFGSTAVLMGLALFPVCLLRTRTVQAVLEE